MLMLSAKEGVVNNSFMNSLYVADTVVLDNLKMSLRIRFLES